MEGVPTQLGCIWGVLWGHNAWRCVHVVNRFNAYQYYRAWGTEEQRSTLSLTSRYLPVSTCSNDTGRESRTSPTSLFLSWQNCPTAQILSPSHLILPPTGLWLTLTGRAGHPYPRHRVSSHKGELVAMCIPISNATMGRRVSFKGKAARCKSTMPISSGHRQHRPPTSVNGVAGPLCMRASEHDPSYLAPRPS